MNPVTSQHPPGEQKESVHVERIELRGHIIESLLLPKVLDCITSQGGTFEIKSMAVGQTRSDPSRALIEIRTEDLPTLEKILGEVTEHGAVLTASSDCRLAPADIEGTLPEGFYSTTNQRTQIRLGGKWLSVDDQEMDCGIVVGTGARTARCVPLTQIRVGDRVIVGHAGVRVMPQEKREAGDSFGFMSSDVSTEKPKGVAIREIANDLVRHRKEGGKTLLVGGPAIVHTGSGQFLCRLIRSGYVDVLFAGNALAAHDIEQALFGTSLGVYVDRGCAAPSGHEHHLRAINRIRRVGGIRQAVAAGVLESGIMYECIENGVDFLLAGSIRDDGPLTEVITDVLEAQQMMREKLRGVTYCLMIATALHSIAVGNLLPAWVKVVCIDINPSTAIKLADRGSFQTVSLVTDVQPTMQALVQELATIEAAGH